MIDVPAADEYAPSHADYIGRVPSGPIVETLARQCERVTSLLGGLSDGQARFRFAPGEWSIKEVVGHMIDAERFFYHRAFTISRKDPAPLPGFEQDDYVREAGFDAWPLADLLDEFALLRRANLVALRHVTPAASLRRGTADGKSVSVRALVYILAGHVEHHLDALRTKYLVPANRG
ncbi:MAG TPA: DinB family protein [Methylomirabilota bacterium]